MPVATPSGTAKNAVVSMTRVEPTRADKMPACPGRRDGKLVKNSQVSRGAPSIAMSTNSVTKVSTPIMSAITPQTMKMVSQRLRRRMSTLNSVTFTETPAKDVARDVAGQREQHEREAGGEDGL